MRLVRSCRRVKKRKDLGKRIRDKDMAAFGGSVKRVLKIPETKCGSTSFLLLPSHRAYGIFGMGFP
jgi:hypothetical protein